MKNEFDAQRCTGSTVAGTPTCDLSKYRPQLATLQTDGTAADEFLKSLWFIACSFVELGFDVEKIKDLPFMQELAAPALDQEVNECERDKEAGRISRQCDEG